MTSASGVTAPDRAPHSIGLLGGAIANAARACLTASGRGGLSLDMTKAEESRWSWAPRPSWELSH